MKRTSTAILTSAAILLALLAGCGKHDEKSDAHAKSDGHNHGSSTPKESANSHDEHEGHDHEHSEDEHSHGEEEGSHADEVKLTKEAVTRAGIRVEPVKKQVILPVFTAPGRVTFNTEATAHVGTAISGRAADIKAKVGDRVKSGEVLLIVESTELGEAQSELLLKIASVRAATPGVDLARAAYERGKSLHTESQGISLTDLQKREADFRSAEATLISAQAAVAAAQTKLRLIGMSAEAIERLMKTGELNSRLPIIAPISGEVIAREVTLGELVRPESDALLILADLSSIWVVADVPESRLADVAVGASVLVEVTGMQGKTIRGKVSYIAPQLDPITRTVSARIDIRQPDEGQPLRPGMFAQMTITSSRGSLEPMIAVPDEAIQLIEGGPAVFVPVEGEENTFAKRSIKTAPRIGEWVPILSGLSEGEKIVVSGSFLLKADLGKAGAAHEH